MLGNHTSRWPLCISNKIQTYSESVSFPFYLLASKEKVPRQGNFQHSFSRFDILSILWRRQLLSSLLMPLFDVQFHSIIITASFVRGGKEFHACHIPTSGAIVLNRVKAGRCLGSSVYRSAPNGYRPSERYSR